MYIPLDIVNVIIMLCIPDYEYMTELQCLILQYKNRRGFDFEEDDCVGYMCDCMQDTYKFN